MDAAAYFAQVEAAVRAHRNAELVAAFGEPRHEGAARGSTPGDPTARAAEARARALETLRETEAVIGEALRRIECLRLVVGDRARVLELRHVDLMPWEDVAAELGVSVSTARRWHDVACEWADAFGWAHVASATGTAQA